MHVHARLARGLGPVLAMLSLSVGCASSEKGSYGSLRAEIDRSEIEARRERERDDRALAGPVLDRRTYVRAVLHRNPSIDAARSAWRAAVARVRQEGSLPDPSVELQVAPLSIGSSSVRMGWQAMVSQRLPWPGKLGFEESVARAESEAARQDFEAMQRELALSASLLYDEYFVAERSLEVNEAHVALLRDLKAGALAQFESGRASAQDPLQAEVELTHLEHFDVVLRSQRTVTVAKMNELLHREPSLALPPPVKELALPDGPDAGANKHLADEAVAKRPDIDALRLRARAEEARIRRAERESYPDLTLSTTYSTMWDMPEHRWMVGVGFPLPIHLARRAGAVDEAEAGKARLESQAASLSDKARTEVAIALEQLEEAHHVAMLFDSRLVPVAREQVDAARAGFVASRNDFVAVVAAEKNLRSVELDWQIARANVDRRRAELDRALGRIPGIGEREAAR